MKLLVAIDMSPITQKVLDTVKRIAVKTDPKIWIVHVVSPDPDFIGWEVGPQTERDFIAQKFQEKHKSLQEIAESLNKEGLNVTPLLLQGPTVETILNEAEDIDADMIITGSHGHGKMYNIFVGSISKEILNNSTRPVMIIPVREKNKE